MHRRAIELEREARSSAGGATRRGRPWPAAWLWLLASVVCATSAPGCARFGYSERNRSGGAGSDAGSDAGRGGRSSDAGDGGDAAATGGRGGKGADPAHDASAPLDADTVEPGDAATHGEGGTGPLDGGDPSDVDDDEDGDSDSGDPVEDAGVSPWCPELPGMLFCDGFEDPELGRWGYSIVQNGTLDRTTDRVRTGLASLRATTGAAAEGNAARYATPSLGGQMSGELWFRYYYFLTGDTVVNSHFSAGVMSELQEPYQGFQLLIRSTRIDIGGLGGPYPNTITFPRDRWVCVELHVLIHPSAGVLEIYLDGDLAIASPPIDTLPAAGYRVAEVGIHYAEAAQGPIEAYVDDVLIARQRTGCD